MAAPSSTRRRYARPSRPAPEGPPGAAPAFAPSDKGADHTSRLPARPPGTVLCSPGAASTTRPHPSARAPAGRAVSAVTPATRASRAVPWRILLAAAGVVALLAAVVSIRDTLLVVFLGIFAALVFEIPLRAFMRWTKLGRGLSATIVVLGTTVAVTILGPRAARPARRLAAGLPEEPSRPRPGAPGLRRALVARGLGGGGEHAAGRVEPRGLDPARDLLDPRRRRIRVLRRAHHLHAGLPRALPAHRHGAAARGRSQHADAGRRRTLARGLGERHRDGLPVGDRRPDDRA